MSSLRQWKDLQQPDGLVVEEEENGSHGWRCRSTHRCAVGDYHEEVKRYFEVRRGWLGKAVGLSPCLAIDCIMVSHRTFLHPFIHSSIHPFIYSSKIDRRTADSSQLRGTHGQDQPGDRSLSLLRVHREREPKNETIGARAKRKRNENPKEKNKVT